MLISSGIENDHWSTQYIYTTYFILITMSTIGYGDISPVSISERIFGSIVTLIACGVFAYSVNCIGSIF